MRGTVENFMAVICGQVVDTLVDPFVESEDPLQVQGIDTITFIVLRDFLSKLVVHF